MKKMTKLLVGVFLGLLVVIHSSPIDSITQIPAGTEEDVIEEARTDGFLVEHFFTTEPPKINTTVQASQAGSGDGSSSNAPQTQSPDMPSTISSQEDSVESSGDTIFSSTSTTSVPTSTMQSGQSTTTQERIRANNGSKTRSLVDIVNNFNTFPSYKDSINGNGFQLPQETENGGMHKGHSTPDWIIILAFLVSLAALIALCAAIATRDKWNGPDQISVKKTNNSNQKKELEMQTFLHTEEPMENGKETEYTVVPLDDLAECSKD